MQHTRPILNPWPVQCPCTPVAVLHTPINYAWLLGPGCHHRHHHHCSACGWPSLFIFVWVEEEAGAVECFVDVGCCWRSVCYCFSNSWKRWLCLCRGPAIIICSTHKRIKTRCQALLQLRMRQLSRRAFPCQNMTQPLAER